MSTVKHVSLSVSGSWQVSEVSQGVHTLARAVHFEPTADNKLKLDDQCAKWFYSVTRLGAALDAAVNPVVFIKTTGSSHLHFTLIPHQFKHFLTIYVYRGASSVRRFRH